MRGGAQESLLRGLPRVAASTAGGLYRLAAGYPALRRGDDGLVHGEVTGTPLSEAHLGLLDLYEGVGQGLYYRAILDVRVGLRTIRAWGYVMERPQERGGVRIASGRWRFVRQR